MPGLGYSETATLELGMEARRDSIPPKERCEACDGRGMVRIGCAITHAVYSECFHCLSTGLKDRVPLAI